MELENGVEIDASDVYFENISHYNADGEYILECRKVFNKYTDKFLGCVESRRGVE